MSEKETRKERSDKGSSRKEVCSHSNKGAYKQPSGQISALCARGRHEPYCMSLGCSCKCHEL
jgi:hypothetical protein